jgi:hypothetical protein
MIVYVDLLFKYILKGYVGITLFLFIFIKIGLNKKLIQNDQIYINKYFKD